MLLAALALAVTAGLWGLRRATDASEYFAAGRRAGPLLVGIAGTAAALSAFTFVGGPGLFMVAGMGSLWMILSAPLTGALQCWAVGEPVLRVVRERGVVTLPALVGARFPGRAPRAAAAAVVAFGCVASLAVQARAAAVLGESLLAVPGAGAAALVMAATALYTSLGGMRAGLLADAVQGALMAAVAVALAVAAVHAAGGPATALATLARLRPDLLGPFGRVPPAQAVAWLLLFGLGTCAQPHYVQKFLFLRDRSALATLPAVMTAALALTLTVWVGVALGGTALLASGAIAVPRPDALTPAVLRHLGSWALLLGGIGVLAALMSTAASFLNLAAAALTRDLPEALGRGAGGIVSARWATLAVAAAATAAGAGSERAIAMLAVFGWGFFTATLLPVLVLGLAWRSPGPRAATVAMVLGAAVDLVLEALRSGLPAGLEPGLAGAAVGVLVLVGSAWRR